MNAKITLINDLENKNYFLVTLVEGEEIILPITEQQYLKFESLDPKITYLPF